MLFKLHLVSSLSTPVKRHQINPFSMILSTYRRSHQKKMCSASGLQIYLWTFVLDLCLESRKTRISPDRPRLFFHGFLFLTTTLFTAVTLRVCTGCKLLSSVGNFSLLICQGFLHQHLCCCRLMQAGIFVSQNAFFGPNGRYDPLVQRHIP